MAVDPSMRALKLLWLCAFHRRSLQLACRACPHMRLLPAAAVWWLFQRRGWSEALVDVPARFYCSRCWRERFRRQRCPRLSLSRDPAPPCDLPLPPDREWRQMADRYRG